MILWMKGFGSFEEWVVRFPSIFAFLLTGILNFFLVKRFLSTKTALLSGLFLWTSADILFYGSVNAGEIDLQLTPRVANPAPAPECLRHECIGHLAKRIRSSPR